jgi:hypothetical protein
LQIVEQKVDSGESEIFNLDEFLSRPLFAHLSTASADGPRESPVWFLWEGAAVWIIGGESFPRNIQRERRVAIGFVDFNPVSGMLHHVGMRGTAEVLPHNQETAKRIIQKYCGPGDSWDRRFEDIRLGTCNLPMIRFVPTKVVMRDQSYRVGRSGTESQSLRF